MLDRGLGLLAEETARLGEGGVLPGDVAFKLYDTFGFPLDLTQDALREQGKRSTSPGSMRPWPSSAAAPAPPGRAPARRRRSASGSTCASRSAPTEFLGYSTETAEARSWHVVGRCAEPTARPPAPRWRVLLNQTPFYAESGGQVGDTGRDHRAQTACGSGSRDTQKKLGALFVHLGRVEAGEAAVGAAVLAEVDHGRRTRIRAHHSATHLLHEALRRRLGHARGAEGQPERARPAALRREPAAPDDRRRPGLGRGAR